MTTRLKKWDVQDHLKTPKQVAAFWEAILVESEGDAKVLTNALNEIARSKGMAELARKAGMTRAGLYKALGPGGNPSFASMMRLLHAMKLAPFSSSSERVLHGVRR